MSESCGFCGHDALEGVYAPPAAVYGRSVRERDAAYAAGEPPSQNPEVLAISKTNLVVVTSRLFWEQIRCEAQRLCPDCRVVARADHMRATPDGGLP